jgi:glycine oxidase
VISIIGGGLVGLCCAWELVQRGHSVRIFDPGKYNSSWAGAGMLAPDHESFPDPLWRERAREAALSFGEWVAKLGGDVDFQAPVLESDGRIRDGHVDPRDLVRELRSKLNKYIQFIPQIIDYMPDGKVVIAAGAAAQHLGTNEPNWPQVEPVKGYLLSWELPPGLLSDVRHLGATYVFQRRRGTVIAGSTEERSGFSEDVDWGKIRDLERRAAEVLPALSGRRPSQIWWGFRPGTPDGNPVVRRWNERIVLAYGHYRNGILLAPWTGRWVADQFPAS